MEITFQGKVLQVKELSYDEVLALPVGERVLYLSGEKGKGVIVSANVVDPQPVHEIHGDIVGKLKYGKEDALGYANIWKSSGDSTGVYVEIK